MHSYVINQHHLSDSDARKWFGQICEAVAYLHELGFAHRDIKLENVMLDRVHGCIKLVDFGFSSALDQGKFEDFPGSAPYASPQLISGIPYEGRSADVWSLGVILFAMLVGEYPFWDKDQPKLVRHILCSEPDFRGQQITPSAHHLICSMLEKNVLKRATLDTVQRHPWMRPEGTGTPAVAPAPAARGSTSSRVTGSARRPSGRPAPFKKLSFEH